MAFDPSGISLHVGRGLNDGLNVRGWSEERMQVSGVRWSDGGQDAGPEWGKDARTDRGWGLSPLSAMGLQNMTVPGSSFGAGQSCFPNLSLPP